MFVIRNRDRKVISIEDDRDQVSQTLAELDLIRDEDAFVTEEYPLSPDAQAFEDEIEALENLKNEI